MNFVQKRLNELLIAPEKYTPDDLHEIKNCLCFIRDSDDSYEVYKNEQFLKEYIRHKENNIPVDINNLKLKFGLL